MGAAAVAVVSAAEATDPRAVAVDLEETGRRAVAVALVEIGPKVEVDLVVAVVAVEE